ncbi:MAG TPA: NADH-quinone oxidoreductase subunit J [Candidatus Limnocylindrales bacterium]|nr:NADH-quinone oxidoreductase subunit J [Candidatus Limnocylindrales bacterium]
MLDLIEPIVFGLLAGLIVAAGLAVVLMNRVTASALFMAFTFLCMAGMFVLLGAETIAAFQVLIYVGAITVLILYGVMFTPQRPRPYALFFQKQTPWGAVFVAILAIPTIVLAMTFRDPGTAGPKGGDIVPLARAIFGDHVFAFEVAGVLLLAATIGAIVLVRREHQAEVEVAARARAARGAAPAAGAGPGVEVDER